VPPILSQADRHWQPVAAAPPVPLSDRQNRAARAGRLSREAGQLRQADERPGAHPGPGHDQGRLIEPEKLKPNSAKETGSARQQAAKEAG
jgi:hypothetical protein